MMTVRDVTPCSFKVQAFIDERQKNKKHKNISDLAFQFPPIQHGPEMKHRSGSAQPTSSSFLCKQESGMTRTGLALHTQRCASMLQSANSSPAVPAAHAAPAAPAVPAGAHLGDDQIPASRKLQTKSAELFKYRQKTPETAAQASHRKRLLREESGGDLSSHVSSESSNQKNKNCPTNGNHAHAHAHVSFVSLRGNHSSTTTTLVKQKSQNNTTEGDDDVTIQDAPFLTTGVPLWRPKPQCISEDTFMRCCEWLQGVHGAQRSIASLHASTLPPVRWSQENK